MSILQTAVSGTAVGLFKELAPGLSAITAAIGGLWAVVSFMMQRREAQRQRAIEAKDRMEKRARKALRPFRQKQLELYFETTQVVGKVASLKRDTPEWEAMRQRFWELYWSEMCLVEHLAVEAAMVHFGAALQECQRNPGDDAFDKQLHTEAIGVAKAIRGSLLEDWGLKEVPA